MSEKRATFPRTHRLGSRPRFARVFDGQVRQSRGPLMAYAVPNGLGHHRIGIAVGRRVGNAVRRNRIKRLLREAYRLSRHDLPGAYDLVIVVRPHEPWTLERYRQALAGLVAALHETWSRKEEATDEHR